jgi:hypothetical protein
MEVHVTRFGCVCKSLVAAVLGSVGPLGLAHATAQRPPFQYVIGVYAANDRREDPKLLEPETRELYKAVSDRLGGDRTLILTGVTRLGHEVDQCNAQKPNCDVVELRLTPAGADTRQSYKLDFAIAPDMTEQGRPHPGPLMPSRTCPITRTGDYEIDRCLGLAKKELVDLLATHNSQFKDWVRK